MLAATALAVALGLVPSAHQRSEAVQLLQDACVTTGMRRADLEQLARARRWREARVTSSTAGQGGWNLVYRASSSLVMMSNDPSFGAWDPSIGSLCTVAVERTSPSIVDEVSALAAELELSEDPATSDLPAGAIPMQSWSRLGEFTLTYAATPDGQATISLSRQVVSTITTSAPAPGN